MKVIELLRNLHKMCHFQTREGRKVGEASVSELKRWCNNNAVILNNERVKWDQEIQYPITSLVLFPKNPVTLW